MNKPGQKTAMISSTSLDLPAHRRDVEKACLREGVFPIGMEHLPARDADAIRVSMEMVDKGDIYIGLFAWRYGHKPEGHDISITEMEFNRAIERKIPILVFLIHRDHPLTIQMVETDKDAQTKLAELKERASKGRGRREFKSPEELRGEVIHALSDLKQREQESSGEKAAPDFHPPNIIPEPPEPYIAHPYSLLQTKDVVGRQAELNLLTDWVTTNKQVPANTRLFNLVAIGGMGKSALTWKWFNDIVPNKLPKLAGRLWWSFYESDAHWENFIIRALAYVSGQSEKAVREMKAPDREDQLWRILDQQPFLLVLDGLERILLAYARMDAAQMLDEDLDDKTANRVAQAIGLPQSAADSFIGKHQLRLAADHRAGDFLRRLARIRNSRILITTRLYPTELQCETGEPLPGCFAQFLTGLTDNDALNLWREFKVTGSSEQLLPLFRSFGNYPLLIRALAGEVAAFRGGPGDFDKWRAQNPDFDPTRLPLKNAKTHVLEYALHGLPDEHRKVLHTIAAFRMPATWETLRALLVAQERGLQAASTLDAKRAVKRAEARAPMPCATDQSLDLILTELEDRGLVGWDKKSNRYDLHPIVRGVVWAVLAAEAKQGIYHELHTYFDAVPPPPDWEQVKSLEELTASMELFQTLVGLKRFKDAFRILIDRLFPSMHFALGANRLLGEFLDQLFPSGLETRLEYLDDKDQSGLLVLFASVSSARGTPGIGIQALRRALEHRLVKNEGILILLPIVSSTGFLFSGLLREFDGLLRQACKSLRNSPGQRVEESVLTSIGASLLALRGEFEESRVLLQRARRLDSSRDGQWFVHVAQSQISIWQQNPADALRSVLLAMEHPLVGMIHFQDVRVTRLHGEAALDLDDLATAEDRLQNALAHSRAVNLVEEELPALSALANFHQRRQQYELARELLEQVWVPAERGPYPLWHADALNVLSQIERDQGNRDAAIAAATKAYTLAWCDGPPYAYHYGLTNARKHLQELGAPEPQLPPFDESKFEPMPDVELNPKDEFWVDPSKLDSP